MAECSLLAKLTSGQGTVAESLGKQTLAGFVRTPTSSVGSVLLVETRLHHAQAVALKALQLCSNVACMVR